MTDTDLSATEYFPEYLPKAPVPRVESLLEQMTLAEKVGQMTQVSLFDNQQDADVDRMLDLVRQGKIGSFLNASDRETRNELQRAAVGASRLGIPLLFGRDVIHGFRTIFPIPLAQAASFDPGLARAIAAVAAREASESGIDWVFAPMVDVTREPRWGRVAEGYGEDPLVASRFGAGATCALCTGAGVAVRTGAARFDLVSVLVVRAAA